MTVYAFDKLIAETRRLAVEYRKATGKPLPVTGEIARHDAARALDLELVEAQSGYDAVGRGERDGMRVQIKGRAIFEQSRSAQRIGQLKTGQDWDLLVLVLLDDAFEAYEIYEADRETVENALDERAGASRAKRGAMTVARMKAISRLAWSRASRPEDTGYSLASG